jgi:hypothetical protein
MGCEAAMASEHEVEITTGAEAFEKSTVFAYSPQADASGSW